MEYPKTVRFTSTHACLRVILIPSTTREIDGQLVRDPGKQLKFERMGRGFGECICTDPETIKLALTDKYYGTEFISPEWEKMKHEEKLKQEALKNADVQPVQEAKRAGRPRKTA